MGIDTIAFLNGRIELLQLAEDLMNLYHEDQFDRGDFTISLTFDKNFYKIGFKHKRLADWKEMDYVSRREWRTNNNRSMCVFYDIGDKESYPEIDFSNGPMTYLSLGMWGDSVEIMESLLKKYGGYLKRNDCYGDWETYHELG